MSAYHCRYGPTVTVRSPLSLWSPVLSSAYHYHYGPYVLPSADHCHCGPTVNILYSLSLRSSTTITMVPRVTIVAYHCHCGPHCATLTGRDFVQRLLAKNARDRISAKDALTHPWMTLDLPPLPATGTLSQSTKPPPGPRPSVPSATASSAPHGGGPSASVGSTASPGTAPRAVASSGTPPTVPRSLTRTASPGNSSTQSPARTPVPSLEMPAAAGECVCW